MTSQNPLLESSTLPFGAIPFDRIRDEHFDPALESALASARGKLKAIREERSEPAFGNVIEALEQASEDVDLVSSVFSQLVHAHTNEKLQALSKELMPKLAEFSNDISLDEGLFARVKAVWDQRSKMNLDTERERLLEKTYKFFVRNGAKLDEKGKARLREIDGRLAFLAEQFSEQVLKATNAFELWISDRRDLEGLPDSIVAAARQAAKEHGRGNGEECWLFTLHFPSYVPFMKYSARRELREKMWRAYESRATSGATDNRPVLLEIARLRHERARLLGYETHAHFTLEERMAGSPETVRSFVDRIYSASKPAAERELAELREFAGTPDLKRWDFAYWSEKLQQKKFGFDEETLRPYFRLENVIQGVFEHARRLYGLTFEPRRDIPVYHPDVIAYEVKDEKTAEHVGVFYADFFPRKSKQGGAWMSALRDQGVFHGSVSRPFVAITCNLTKPTPEKPALLGTQEVRTVFHEFGHALHGLLSRVRYRSLAGTNVYWDFVELPSQIMENWVREKEGLDLFARHYETGAAIPEELVGKIRAAARFQAGWQSLRQLTFGKLDLAWHAKDPAGVEDVESHEREAIRDCMLFEPIPGMITSCSFSHIFAGGYSAGYYSYKWAEVLEADAFEYFREKGIFSQEVAEKFKNLILSRGGTEHPMELYKRFRGREPDADALLRRDGLL